jgi:hypothetical protein
MRKGRVLGYVTVAVGLLALGVQAVPAQAATPTFFGAKLTVHSQPSNAEQGYSCDENAGIPKHGDCTWVATEAFENGSHFTAPTTGTILHVSLISCVPGSFVLQVAHANLSKRTAQVIANGPTITYAGQSKCRNKFVIQTFPVSVPVTQGDYMAIVTPSTGALSCSGGSGVMLFSPPLSAGGPSLKTKSGASCDLLVQYSYI